MDTQNVLRAAQQQCAESLLEVSHQELDWMMEEATGLSRIQRIMGQEESLQPNWIEVFNGFVTRRLHGEPTQYILGKGAFYGRDFVVTPDVLIPRPETELLAEWVINRGKLMDEPRILDLGTGSGCIAITLALELDNSQVTGIDISKEALHVAKKNAALLGANVSFLEADMLSDALPSTTFDIIVSNPPYVPLAEKFELQKEVVEHEPHMALFPGLDPLLFYRRLAELGPTVLKNGGWMAMEMHTSHARETRSFFDHGPFTDFSVHPDLAGLDRFVTVRVDPS